MAAQPAAHEHDDIRFKEVFMQTSWSQCAAWLAAKLPARWARWCFQGGLSRSRVAAPRGGESEQAGGDEACCWGCGWFDSSHELVNGLQVEEGGSEALSALPLTVWLQLELAGVGPATPSV